MVLRVNMAPACPQVAEVTPPRRSGTSDPTNANFSDASGPFTNGTVGHTPSSAGTICRDGISKSHRSMNSEASRTEDVFVGSSAGASSSKAAATAAAATTDPQSTLRGLTQASVPDISYGASSSAQPAMPNAHLSVPNISYVPSISAQPAKPTAQKVYYECAKDAAGNHDAVRFYPMEFPLPGCMGSPDETRLIRLPLDTGFDMEWKACMRDMKIVFDANLPGQVFTSGLNILLSQILGGTVPSPRRQQRTGISRYITMSNLSMIDQQDERSPDSALSKIRRLDSMNALCGVKKSGTSYYFRFDDLRAAEVAMKELCRTVVKLTNEGQWVGSIPRIAYDTPYTFQNVTGFPSSPFFNPLEAECILRMVLRPVHNGMAPSNDSKKGLAFHVVTQFGVVQALDYLGKQGEVDYFRFEIDRPTDIERMVGYFSNWRGVGSYRSNRIGYIKVSHVNAEPMTIGKILAFDQSHYFRQPGDPIRLGSRVWPGVPRANWWTMDKREKFLWMHHGDQMPDHDIDHNQDFVMPRELSQVVFPQRIWNLSEVRTSVMLRNVPNKLSAHDLKRLLDIIVPGMYDFMYLRVDFRNQCNVGYAFINFVIPDAIVPFYLAVKGKKWLAYGSQKSADVCWAMLQGKETLIEKFRNSGVLEQWAPFGPKLIGSHLDGHYAVGQPVPFPPVNNETKLKRSVENAVQVGLFVKGQPDNRRNGCSGRSGNYDRGTIHAQEEEMAQAARQRIMHVPQMLPVGNMAGFSNAYSVFNQQQATAAAMMHYNANFFPMAPNHMMLINAPANNQTANNWNAQAYNQQVVAAASASRPSHEFGWALVPQRNS